MVLIALLANAYVRTGSMQSVSAQESLPGQSPLIRSINTHQASLRLPQQSGDLSGPICGVRVHDDDR